ncbi:MAG: hypothetical protein K8S54_03185, partial [Spirochaetia bacterium]|nr:hypothetical protein [Spirochaetia bacterium]
SRAAERLYPGDAKAWKGIYNCSIQVRLTEPSILSPSTVTQVADTVEERLAEHGINCQDHADLPRLTLDLTISNEYGYFAMFSSYLSAFSLSLIPGYMGELRHTLGVSIELKNGNKSTEQRLNYVSSGKEFMWLVFAVGGFPGGYLQRQSSQAIDECVSTLVHDLDRLQDVPNEERYSSLVVLKDARRYYRVRAVEKNGTLNLKTIGGETIAIPMSQVDSVKAMSLIPHR